MDLKWAIYYRLDYGWEFFASPNDEIYEIFREFCLRASPAIKRDE